MRRTQVLGPSGRAACGIKHPKGEYAGRVFLSSRAINRPDWRDRAANMGYAFEIAFHAPSYRVGCVLARDSGMQRRRFGRCDRTGATLESTA